MTENCVKRLLSTVWSSLAKLVCVDLKESAITKAISENRISN